MILPRFASSIEVLKRSATDPDTRVSLEAIQDSIGKPVDPAGKPKLIEAFKYDIPDHSLDSWCEYLRNKGKEPHINVHWKKEDDRLFRNSNEKSWLIDEVKMGYEYRDRCRDKLDKAEARAQPDGAKAESKSRFAELDQAYDDGLFKARMANAEARKHSPTWLILKRSSGNDRAAEDAVIQHLEPKKPDWYATIRRLKDLGREKGYTEKHYKECLDRWVSFFCPQLRTITQYMQPPELGAYLSNLTMPE